MKRIKTGKIMLYQLWTVIMISIMILPVINGVNVQAAGNSDKITLSKLRISLREGITGKIAVKNKPAGAIIRWSSKNKKIAKVKKGVVTGLKQGKTVVSCKVVYRKGRKKYTRKLKATVTVRNNKQVYPKHKPYGKGSRKYKKGEKIAIKANINGSGVFDDDDSGKTKMSYTNPVLLKALLTSVYQRGIERCSLCREK